jgi:4-hydroxy-3-methylbut-2-enyl diphosphate reductase
VTAAVVCTPLRSERAALLGAVNATVLRTGMGPSRRVDATGPVLVAGVAGALTDGLRPGDLVVAAELRTAGTTTASHAAPLLFGAVRRLGLAVHFGPLLSQERLAYGPHLAAAATAGALAVDMESAYLAGQAPVGQTVAIRAISDTPAKPLLRPGIVWRGVIALRALRAAAPAIDQWAAAVDDRDVVVSDSVAALADRCDIVLVLGALDSEAVKKCQIPVHFVDSVESVDLRWLAGARRVGIVSKSSTPPGLADELIGTLSGLGQLTMM